MIRTLISLGEQDKSWLDRTAKKTGLSMAELVREAIRRMRHQEEVAFEKLLQETSGLWPEGDGLEYQQRIRQEWP